ncbi:MAG: hypothetical protein MRY83_21160, partial [Flavobacteriales bacterium]|nr:hypothetical protein [Flavobacteriales bacterium]
PRIFLKNFHCDNLVITGLGGKKEIGEKLNFILEPGLHKDFTELEVSTKENYIYFQKQNSKEEFKKLISNWEAPKAASMPNEIQDNSLPTDIAKLINDTFFVRKGSHELKDKIYYIGKNQTLVVSDGTTITLSQAGIVSEGPVIINGTEQNKVHFNSNGFNYGLTVFGNQNDTSYIQNAAFDNLSALDYNGWTLTGACTFYECHVKLRNVTFSNTKSEDALNIIRSSFDIKSCTFQNVSSDAFDADFCLGSILNSSFKQIGNDGIDFSGSQIEADNVSFEIIADKAVSIGENSTASISNLKIESANVGVASKDYSETTIHSANISNCKYGFAAYQKKPEFGPASIIVKELRKKDVSKPALVGRNSTITLPNNSYIGKEKIEIEELLY